MSKGLKFSRPLLLPFSPLYPLGRRPSPIANTKRSPCPMIEGVSND